MLFEKKIIDQLQAVSNAFFILNPFLKTVSPIKSHMIPMLSFLILNCLQITIWVTFILNNAFITTKKDHKLQTIGKIAKILKIC